MLSVSLLVTLMYRIFVVVLKGRSWIVKRSYEDFRVLDKHLHLCIYDRRFSQLPELPRLDSLTDQSEVSTENIYTLTLWIILLTALNTSVCS